MLGRCAPSRSDRRRQTVILLSRLRHRPIATASALCEPHAHHYRRLPVCAAVTNSRYQYVDAGADTVSRIAREQIDKYIGRTALTRMRSLT